jgi:hypothetical protein
MTGERCVPFDWFASFVRSLVFEPTDVTPGLAVERR